MSAAERVSKARMSSDLKWNDEFERSIDVVTASGHASTLGGILVRLKGGDSASFKPALYLLVKKQPERFTRNMAEKICKQALYEWAYDKCQTCLGAKETQLKNGVIITCQDCGGVGVRHWKDWERAQSLGLPLKVYRRHWFHHIPAVLNQIDTETRNYSAVVNDKLRMD